MTGVDAGALSRVGPRDDTGAVIWHLVSGNNRMLARSAQIFGSIPEAVLGAESAIAAVVHLVVALVDEDGGGERGWYAKLAEVPILTCARWYRSERDRRNSIDSAITSLESATLRPGSSLMSPARTGSA
ncbi:MAG: hypothetical protein H7146_02445 [Burkholderiaceae bacterium]|nr:hypothetical protein [Microbacteriaceae bacterium]